MKCFVIVREESPGKFVAWPAGIPELKATAESRERAQNAVFSLLLGSMLKGELISIDLPEVQPVDRPEAVVSRDKTGAATENWGADPNDPDEIEYVRDLQRYRQEDRERTIREFEEMERRESEQKAG